MTPLQRHITTLTPVQQTIALAVLAYGPVTANDLADITGRKPNQIHGYASTLRKVLLPHGELTTTDAGYVISPVKQPVATALPPAKVRVVGGTAATSLGFDAPNSGKTDVSSTSVKPSPAQAKLDDLEPAEPKKIEKRRRIFLLPWGGYVELPSIVSVFGERGQVVIQLRNGGYIRSERRPDAEEIVVQLTAFALGGENVEIVNAVSGG